MFSIETINDVKILKELTKTTNETKIQELEQEIQQLTKLTQEQNKIIKKLKENQITTTQCRDIVFELLANSSKTDIIKEKAKKIQKKELPSEEDEFFLTNTMKKKYNKIIVDGNELIHHTIRNQKMPLPITTIELLALVEIYQKRQRKLLNKDFKNICKIFKINKVQFGKIYYNLKEGIFFKAIDEINNQIRKTNFKIKNGQIHIVDGANLINTKVDIKTFNYCLNIYVNSNQPYATIYKIAKEKKNINPIFLLSILKKNTAVSKAISLEA